MTHVKTNPKVRIAARRGAGLSPSLGLLCGALLLVMHLPAAGRSGPDWGRIRGKVVLDDGLPLHGVTVLIVQLGRSMETDKKGSYQFDRVPSGAYDIFVAGPALVAERHKILLAAGDRIAADFRMRRMPIRESPPMTANGRKPTSLGSSPAAFDKQAQTLDDVQKSDEELEIEAKQSTSSAPPQAGPADQNVSPEQVQQQVRELKEELDAVVEAQKKVVPSVFNPSLGLVSETLFSRGSEPAPVTDSGRPGGFDVFQRSIELNLAASVDPFARGYAVVNASVDPITGEAAATVEEAAIVVTSLPWNLALKAGRFFGEFGRLSYIHDHELPFANRPLVLDQYVGGESKTDGVQINFLLPIPHYVSLTVGAGTQFGDTPNNVGDFRHLNNLNFFGRVSTSFDLTPDISLEPGLSGLWNPATRDRGGAILQPDQSTFTERERRLLGVDLELTYRPLRNNQFKSFTWGLELLYSDNRFDVVSPDGIPSSATVGACGYYSYFTYKFHRQWSAGFLIDWVENAQNNKAKTTAYSPYLTWSLSHWNQLRLQYTHTFNNAATGLRSDDALYLQWAWIIGSHAHGWQER